MSRSKLKTDWPNWEHMLWETPEPYGCDGLSTCERDGTTWLTVGKEQRLVCRACAQQYRRVGRFERKKRLLSTDEEMRRLWTRRREPVSSLAQEFGVSRQTIRQRLKEIGHK